MHERQAPRQGAPRRAPPRRGVPRRRSELDRATISVPAARAVL